MKTYSPKPEDANREWFIVDATDKILGRLATEITTRLRGKHKPEFAPHMDMDAKMYYKHSNHPGGLKEKTLRQMLEIKPENVITAAVKGMLPKNKLAALQLKKLKVYAGPEHPHAAQAPKTLDI